MASLPAVAAPNGVTPRVAQAAHGDTAGASLQEKIPIQRRGDAGVSNSPGSDRVSTSELLVVLGGIVLAILGAGEWLKRRRSTTQAGSIPTAIELLGTCAVTPQTAMHVVRVGERLLIVGSGGDGLRTLLELHDAAEVAQLSHLCRHESQAAAGLWGRSLLRRKSAAPSPSPASATRPSLNGEGDRPRSAADAAAVGAALETHRRVTGAARAAGFLLVLVLWPIGAAAQFERGDAPAAEASARLPGRSAAVSRTADLLTRPLSTGRSPVSRVDGAAPSPLISPFRGGGPIRQAAFIDAGGSDGASNSARTPADARTAPLATAEGASFLQLSPEGLGSSLRLGLVVGVMSLAPAILLMTTCYVRIIVVLGLLRQALGAPQFPPTQVLTAFSLFLTALAMWPVWERCWREGLQPYSEAAAAGEATPQRFQLALTQTAAPVRGFMSRQIEAAGNGDAIDMLMSYHEAASGSEAPPPAYYDDVPLRVLLPAYVLSELKTAFLLGFQIYLPFVVIDLVVTSVLASLGLGMLSPGVVSLPFKLLLFVMIDGWYLTVELLLRGIAPLGG